MYYLRLILLFVKTELQNEMAYRFNFLITILNSILGLAGGIGGLFILYANKESLNGWSFNETLALLGVYMTVQALIALFVSPSLNMLAGMGGEIESGTFDFTLLKPVPVQFYVSVRKWSLWSLFDLAVGVGVISTAICRMGIVYGPADVILFVISMFISQVMLYSIMLILSSAAFWYRGTYLLWILGDIMQTGRYPVSIYPGFIKLILTWLIPIGFIVTVPAEILTGKANYPMFIGGIILAAVLLITASALFRKSLNKYASASS